MRSLRISAVLSFLLLPMMILSAGTAAAATAPTLGTLVDWAVLGASTVTNTGPTHIEGELGVSPGSAVTGFPPGTSNPAGWHSADAEAGQAQSDLTAAYNTLAGGSCEFDLTGQDLGLLGPLVPGTYCFSSSAQLTGDLVLNAQGNPDSVFIFQIGSTLTTASNSSVGFINGGSCNVYWQIGSSATLGTGTDFTGSILALTSITATTSVTVEGRLLARNGAVTMDSNTVTRPSCAVENETPTPTPSPTPSPSPSPSTSGTTTTSTTPPAATTPVTTPPAAVVIGPDTTIPSGTVISPDDIVISTAPGSTPTNTSPPTSSANPSEPGKPVTFTVVVTPVGVVGPVPTGLVTFIDNSTVIGTVPLNGKGVATLTTSSLSQGDHKITAVFHGGPNFSGSISRILTQQVERKTSIVTITTSTVELVKTGINALPLGLSGSAAILLGAGLLLEDRRRNRIKALANQR